jgi:hypothetical protein
MSPLTLDLALDALEVLKQKKIVTSLNLEFVNGCLVILQYADIMILLLHDGPKAHIKVPNYF